MFNAIIRGLRGWVWSWYLIISHLRAYYMQYICQLPIRVTPQLWVPPQEGAMVAAESSTGTRTSGHIGLQVVIKNQIFCFWDRKYQLKFEPCMYAIWKSTTTEKSSLHRTIGIESIPMFRCFHFFFVRTDEQTRSYQPFHIHF